MSNIEFVKTYSQNSVREILADKFGQTLTSQEIEEMECNLLQLLELFINNQLTNEKEIKDESSYFSKSFNRDARRRVLSGCTIGQAA